MTSTQHAHHHVNLLRITLTPIVFLKTTLLQIHQSRREKHFFSRARMDKFGRKKNRVFLLELVNLDDSMKNL
jgi:hypothetical protein